MRLPRKRELRFQFPEKTSQCLETKHSAQCKISRFHVWIHRRWKFTSFRNKPWQSRLLTIPQCRINWMPSLPASIKNAGFGNLHSYNKRNKMKLLGVVQYSFATNKIGDISTRYSSDHCPDGHYGTKHRILQQDKEIKKICLEISLQSKFLLKKKKKKNLW